MPAWFIEEAARNNGVVMPGLKVSFDLDRCIEGADVVMALRLQLERMQAGLFQHAGIHTHVPTEFRTPRSGQAQCTGDAPGPMNEG